MSDLADWLAANETFKDWGVVDTDAVAEAFLGLPLQERARLAGIEPTATDELRRMIDVFERHQFDGLDVDSVPAGFQVGWDLAFEAMKTGTELRLRHIQAAASRPVPSPPKTAKETT